MAMTVVIRATVGIHGPGVLARSEGVGSLAAPKSGSRWEEVELSGGLVHRSGLTYKSVYLTIWSVQPNSDAACLSSSSMAIAAAVDTMSVSGPGSRATWKPACSASILSRWRPVVT
jgi:hypothetical protein